MSESTKVGELLTSRMNHHHISQEQLATVLGIDPAMITKWKFGDELPSIAMLDALAEAELHYPMVKEDVKFLAPSHTHRLVELYLEALGLRLAAAIEIMAKGDGETATRRLDTSAGETELFRFVTGQQYTLLSQLGGHISPAVDRLSEDPARLDDPADRNVNVTNTALPQAIQHDTEQTELTESARAARLAGIGELFLETLLSQFKLFAPIYMAAREPASWRVAIITPSATRPDFLCIKWHAGLSNHSLRQNRFYIGNDPDEEDHKPGIAGSVFLKEKALAFPPNVTVHPTYRDCYSGKRKPQDIEYDSLVTLPIYAPDPSRSSGKMMFGVLSVDSKSYAFSSRDCLLLQSVADLCGLCIHITCIDYFCQDHRTGR